MPSTRLSMIALACVVGAVRPGLADDAGYARISTPAAATSVRGQSPVRYVDHHEGEHAPPAPAAEAHGESSHEGHSHGEWSHDGGHVVMGDYGAMPGHGWCQGGMCMDGGCMECDPCGWVRVTGNPIIDAPGRLTCELINCLFRRCRTCRGGGHGRHPAIGCRVYAVDPNYTDPRDGRAYSAAGYGVPMTVPVAPTVHHTYNYGWGVPSSRITPISRPAGY